MYQNDEGVSYQLTLIFFEKHTTYLATRDEAQFKFNAAKNYFCCLMRIFGALSKYARNVRQGLC